MVSDSAEVEKSFRFLLYSRALRSIGIIYMTITMPLYLAAMGLSVVSIGFVVAGVMLFMIVETLLLGALGDRAGYKYSLLISEIIPAFGALVIFFSQDIAIIIAAVIVAGIGGAAGGMRGGFSPGSTAIVASNYPDEHKRVRKLGQITSVASFFSVFGAALVSAHFYLSSDLGALAAYRAGFLVSSLLLFFSFICLLFIKEEKRPRKSTRIMKRSSFRYILKVIAANSLGGIGLGLAIPLLPLWLELAYKATTLEIGIIFGISYLITALGAYYASYMHGKFDPLSIASATRVLGGALLIAMALSPFLALVAVVYLLRAFFAGLGNPTRNAVNMRGIDREDYGTATSFQGVSTRVSQLSSGASGYLMEYSLPAPLFLGGAFQIVSGVMYRYLIGRKNQ